MSEEAFTIKIYNIIIERLKISQAIKDFVDEHFEADRKFSIYLGVEQEEEPTEDEYPIIVLGPIQGVGRGDRGNITFASTITMGVTSKSKTKESSSDWEVVKHDGFSLSEKFRVLVENEILALKGVGANINLSGETVLEDFYPIYHSTTIVTFEIPRSNSGGRG